MNEEPKTNVNEQFPCSLIRDFEQLSNELFSSFIHNINFASSLLNVCRPNDDFKNIIKPRSLCELQDDQQEEQTSSNFKAITQEFTNSTNYNNKLYISRSQETICRTMPDNSIRKTVRMSQVYPDGTKHSFEREEVIPSADYGRYESQNILPSETNGSNDKFSLAQRSSENDSSKFIEHEHNKQNGFLDTWRKLWWS